MRSLHAMDTRVFCAGLSLAVLIGGCSTTAETATTVATGEPATSTTGTTTTATTTSTTISRQRARRRRRPRWLGASRPTRSCTGSGGCRITISFAGTPTAATRSMTKATWWPAPKTSEPSSSQTPRSRWNPAPMPHSARRANWGGGRCSIWTKAPFPPGDRGHRLFRYQGLGRLSGIAQCWCGMR